jgi:hypothetical protein
VISTQNEKILGILDLVCQQKADCFQGLLTSVNVISKEQIVGFGWKSAVLEKAQKIIILTMYISTNLLEEFVS